MRLSELLVSVGLEAKGLKRLNQQLGETQRNFKRSFGNIQKGLQNFGRTATMSITAPLIAAGYKSVEAFNVQAKAIAQVEQGLRSTGGTVGYTSKQLQQLASNLQRNTIFGDEEILSGATAQLLTFTNITGEQFARTQVAALDLATRLDGDLKSASIQLGKALNDPIANLSALSRSGIQFSKEQKETIKTLVETNRLADAQTIILDELGKQYGGSAAAAAKAGTGPLKQLSNTLGDISEEFGAILVEVMQPLVGFASNVVSAFANMSKETKTFVLLIAGLLGAAGPIALAVAALMPLIAAITGPVGLVAAAVAAAVVMIIRNLDVVIPAIVKVVNSIITFQNKTKAIGVIFSVIKNIATGVFRFMEVQFRNLVDVIGGVGEAFMLALSGEFSAAGQVLADSVTRNAARTNAAAYEWAGDFAQDLEDAMNAEDIELLSADSILHMVDDVKEKFSNAFKTKGPVEVPVDPKPTTTTTTASSSDTGPTVFQPMFAITDADVAAADDRIKRIGESMRMLGEQMQAVGGAFSDAFGSAFDVILEGGDDMSARLNEIGKKLIQDLIKIAISNAIAAAFSPLSADNAATGGLAGIAKSAFLQGLIPSMMPKLAKGGLAYGPSIATVGDNFGAKMDPEVIAPLSKLERIIGNSGGGVLSGRIAGRDIILSTARDGNRSRRTYGSLAF